MRRRRLDLDSNASAFERLGGHDHRQFLRRVRSLHACQRDMGPAAGHLGQPTHPEVKAATLEAFKRIRAAGKAPGVLTRDDALARELLEHGALMLGVGLDAHLLAAQTRLLAKSFIPDRAS